MDYSFLLPIILFLFLKVLLIILFILPTILFIVPIILIKSEQELVQKKQQYSDTIIIKMYMWQSRVENVHYSALVKKVLIKSLVLPLLRAQVPALFIACTSSYAYDSPLTSGRYIEYACTRYSRLAVKFGKIQRFVSGFTTATNTGQTPTVIRILGLKLKQLWSEIGEQNMRTECQIGAVRIDGKSSLYRQCYNAYCAAFTMPFSFKLGYFLGKVSTFLLFFCPMFIAVVQWRLETDKY